MIGHLDCAADARGTRRCPRPWAASGRAGRGRDRSASNRREGLGAVAGHDDVEALVVEPDPQRVDEGLLVLGEQHLSAAARRSVRRSGDVQASPVSWSGRTSVNVEPSPSRDSTSTRPRWFWATWRTIERPSPVPPVWRLRPVVDPVEALEDPLEVLRAGSRALVGDRDPDGALASSTVGAMLGSMIAAIARRDRSAGISPVVGVHGWPPLVDRAIRRPVVAVERSPTVPVTATVWSRRST